MNIAVVVLLTLLVVGCESAGADYEFRHLAAVGNQKWCSDCYLQSRMRGREIAYPRQLQYCRWVYQETMRGNGPAARKECERRLNCE